MWRADYNDARPHSQLGWQTPTEFAATFPIPRRALALRNAKSSAPTLGTVRNFVCGAGLTITL
jgi:putative transposase